LTFLLEGTVTLTTEAQRHRGTEKIEVSYTRGRYVLVVT
jgi:hypothetical protein